MIMLEIDKRGRESGEEGEGTEGRGEVQKRRNPLATQVESH